MSTATRFGARAYLALAIVALSPFVLGAIAAWVAPANLSIAAIDQGFCVYSLFVLAFMGGVRWGVTVTRPGGVSPLAVVVTMAPPIVTCFAALLGPAIGYRWSLAMVVGAFAVQGGWDLNASDMPEAMKRARPIVTLGALATLLVALLAT